MAKNQTLEKHGRFTTVTRVGNFFSGLSLQYPRGILWSAVGFSTITNRIALTAIIAMGAFLRIWQINRLGYNSDEVVYASQGAAIAADPILKEFFPIFRAHPLLFQFVVGLGLSFGVNDLVGRLFSVVAGLATIYLVAQLGALLYNRRVGLIAALVIALMPYHVIVTRQVLLDGTMTLFATLALYLLARFASTNHPAWLYAAGASMGLTFLSKETGIILLGSIYAFLALSPQIRVRIKDLMLSLICMGAVMAPHFVAVSLAGRSATAQQYFLWQLFRRPNHEWSFYLTLVPSALGILVVLAALAGLWLLRRERTWREVLLVAWIVVPIVFFQLWPTKGFQYLLPTAPALALLAAHAVSRLPTGGGLAVFGRSLPGRWLQPLAIGALAGSLALTTWHSTQNVVSDHMLAGGGGMPGGREAGLWVLQHVPDGGRILTMGPSMANVIQFYGHRKAYGLSVSSNPLRRNPVYEPVINPDAQIRNGEIQYIVYDTFTAARSPYYATTLLKLVKRFNGRAIHSESILAATDDGGEVLKPVIVIYEVRP
jgi:hypothetical protein